MDVEPKDPNRPAAMIWFGVKIALWLLWCVPWGTIGIALLATAFGVPLGIACLGVAAWPLKKMIETRNLASVRYEMRWSYVGDEGEETETPWED